MQSAHELFSHTYFEVDHAYFQLNNAHSRHEEQVNQTVPFKGELPQDMKARKGWMESIVRSS